jgi:hypothetical protein
MTALAVLFCLTVAVFWKIVLTDQFTWFDNPDLVHQVLPWLQEQARQWKNGHVPLWDPHHWAGQSIIGQNQPGVAYPLNWAFAFLPFSDDHINTVYFDRYFVFIHFMGALFCYWLCRDLKCSRIASVIAACSFALSGYIGNIAWPQMLNGAVWAPLVFLFLLRAINGNRPVFSAAAAGSSLGISLLAGHHQIPTFVALAAVLVLLFLRFTSRIENRRLLISIAGFGAFAGLIGAVQLLPAYEYWGLAMRWVNTRDPVTWNDKVPYVAHTQYSLDPVSLIGLAVPLHHVQVSMFVGLTVLALAILSIMTLWQSVAVQAMAIVGGLGISLCLGAFSIFHGLFYVFVPSFDKARNTAFAVFLLQFALAVLAGFGFDALRTRLAADRHVGWLARASLVLALALYAAGTLRGLLNPSTAFAAPAIGYTALNSLALAAIFLVWHKQRMSERTLGVATCGLLLFEIGSVTGATFRHREQGWTYVNVLSAHRDIAEYLRRNIGTDRLMKNGEAMRYNFGDWYNLDEYEGYAGVTSNIIRMHGSRNVQQLVGVRYYLSTKPETEGQSVVFRGSSGVNVYERPDAFPRFWTAHTVLPVKDFEEMRQKVDLPLEELRTKVLLQPPAPSLESCAAGDSITLKEITEARSLVEVDMKCKGMLIVSHNFFPGWIAQIDGERTPIFEAYGFLQGVVVPAGKHRVQFRYQPLSVYAGAALTAVGLVVLTVLGIASRPIRRSPDMLNAVQSPHVAQVQE